MRWIFGDTETTGLGHDAGVVEIAWVETDDTFGKVSTHHSLINPMRPIQHGAMAVHGITDERVANAPRIEQFMEKLGHPLTGPDTVLVAHSAAFDLKFFRPWMTEPKALCTLKAARRLYPKSENHKLMTLSYYLGLASEHDKAHSALGDVRVLLTLARRMCQDSGLDLQGLLALTAKPLVIERISFGKHKGAKLKELPASYVTWLLRQDKLNPDLKLALEGL